MQHCFTQVVDTNSVDTDQLASSSQLVWIYTVCKGSLYPGSVGPGLIHCHFLLPKNVSVGNCPQFLACIYFILSNNGLPALVAQLDAPSYWRPGGRGFKPRGGWQHSFVEIDHEIFSTVILSLPLIQEGQLSVSGETMCTILVNPLED